MTNDDRQFYTVKEFCRRNSIGKTTFYELVQQHIITTIKFGRKTLVPADSEKSWHERLLRPPIHTKSPDDSEQKRTVANASSRIRT